MDRFWRWWFGSGAVFGVVNGVIAVPLLALEDNVRWGQLVGMVILTSVCAVALVMIVSNRFPWQNRRHDEEGR